MTTAEHPVLTSGVKVLLRLSPELGIPPLNFRMPTSVEAPGEQNTAPSGEESSQVKGRKSNETVNYSWYCMRTYRPGNGKLELASSWWLQQLN